MNTKLKKILDKHSQMRFPHSKDHEKLADWLSQLAEVDGYYVGCAQSIIKEKPCVAVEHDPLQTLCLDLQILYESGDIDPETYSECDEYLKSLENLAKALQNPE